MSPMPDLIVLPDSWHKDRHVLIELADDLIERGELVTARDVLYMFERGDKFEGELRRMLAERALEDAA